VCLNRFESDPEAGLKNYRDQCLLKIKGCPWQGGFCYLRNPKEPTKVLAMFTDFHEYSDWRSGNMDWVYDIRVQADLLKDPETLDLVINFYLRSILQKMGSDTPDLKVLRIVVDKSQKQLQAILEKYKMLRCHYYIMQAEL